MKSSGNTVLVTGGGTGIGLALAHEFLRHDNTVIICGRTKSVLEKAKASHPSLHIICADVSTDIGRAEILNIVKTEYQNLNVLINNAGVSFVTSIEQSDYVSHLEAEVQVNLVAPLALMHALLPILRAQVESSIVNVTSGYAFLPSSRMSGYSASKAGLSSATKALRFQLRKTNINLIEVAPPSVDTAMARGLPGMSTQDFAQKVFAQLMRANIEIVVGASRLAKFLSRFLPKFGLKFMNEMEQKDPKYMAPKTEL